MKRLFKITVIAILGFASCKKAELKKPVDINFALDLSEYNGQENLHIQSGEIYLSQFNVNGTRLEGDDIEFMRPFENGLHTDLNGSAEISAVSYTHLTLPTTPYV